MSSRVRTAIIVEDNALFRQLIKMALAAFGVTRIVEAADGVEALESLESSGADIVIMDRKMERMDGIACTRRIRSAAAGCHPELPIVMVSGYGSENDIRTAHDACVDVYLVKPISIQPLYAGILKALDAADSRSGVNNTAASA